MFSVLFSFGFLQICGDIERVFYDLRFLSCSCVILCWVFLHAGLKLHRSFTSVVFPSLASGGLVMARRA